MRGIWRGRVGGWVGKWDPRVEAEESLPFWR